MQFRLTINHDQLGRCRKVTREVAKHLQKYTDRHTSVAIERAGLRALGVTSLHRGAPLTQAVIDALGPTRLREGAAYWLGYIMAKEKCSAETAALALLKKDKLPATSQGFPHGEIRAVTRNALAAYTAKLRTAAQQRPSLRRRNSCLLLAAHTSTGDLGQDLRVLKAAQHEPLAGILFRPPTARDGADWIGKGAGWRGKYDVGDASARLTAALPQRGEPAGPFGFTWGGFNLLAPELGVHLATTPVALIEHDALSATKIDGVHFKRALLDQQFLYRLCARAELGVAIRSHEWTACVDSYERGHELLMGQVLIEALGDAAGLPLDAMRPRHGLMLATPEQAARPDRLACELAHAQLVREIFPQITASFVTSGSIDDIHLGALIAALCDYQRVILPLHQHGKSALGWTADALQRIAQLVRMGGSLCDDLAFVGHGVIARRSGALLERMEKLAQRLAQHDLLTLEKPADLTSLFDITDSGTGADGILAKHKHYWNPLEAWLCQASASS